MSEAQIIRTEYSDVMKKSYIDYAMSYCGKSPSGCEGWAETGTAAYTV